MREIASSVGLFLMHFFKNRQYLLKMSFLNIKPDRFHNALEIKT